MQSRVVVTVNSLNDARSALEESSFDLLLLDINLGHENGLSLLETPTTRLPPRVILLSGISEQEWIFRGFELGAFGFIPKSVEPQELLSAIDRMLGLSLIHI